MLLTALAVVIIHFPNQVLTVDSGAGKADALVVLGGGSRERAQRAAELFKTSEAPLIICSGYGDGTANRDFLIGTNVPAPAILLEPNSRTTRENAKFTIAILRARHLKSAIIVTTWYHSRRALACFEHYAPEIRFYSQPSYFEYPRFKWDHRISKYIKAEYYKIPGYWVCYGVCPIFLHLH